MSTDQSIPIVSTHRGVGIHGFQPAARMAIVRAAIDHVYGLNNAGELARYAADPQHPPEARLLAAARCEATWALAAENRAVRPSVNLLKVHASVAGLDRLGWIDRHHYTSLLDVGAGPAVRRESPLTDEQIKGLAQAS